MIRFREFESLGLGLAAMSDKSDGDCALALGLEGIRDLCGACGINPAGVARVRQVHGTHIVEASDSPGIEVEADGLMTRAHGRPIGVGVADCVPIFLFDPVARCAAVVHAGREGTLRAIATAAVECLVEAFAAAPGRLHALIGPSAGPCCYEVSAPMVQHFTGAGLPVNGRKLDLWTANAQQLVRAGVPESAIRVSGICTICDGRFFSHRADGSGCRNIALLMI